MDTNALFDMRKQPIAVVCSIGNVEIGILFICKEPWEICTKGAMGTPESLMCVLPTSSIRCPIGAFPEEITIEYIPDIQRCRELNFHAITQPESKGTQCFRRLGLRTRGDILLDRQNLMKLAALYDDASSKEHLSYAPPPIDDRNYNSAPHCC